MKIYLIPIAVVSLFLLGCASEATFLQTGQTRPPIGIASVRVYSKPPPRFEEVGIVSCADTSHFSRQKLQDTILDRLKEQAASKGANGLIVMGTGSGLADGPYLGQWAGGSGMFPSKEETIKAMAVYVP